MPANSYDLEPMNHCRPRQLVRAITVALLTFFILASLAGASKPVVCFDREEVHFLQREAFLLTACHFQNAAPAGNSAHPELAGPFAANNQASSCLDISLNPCDSLLRAQQLKLLAAQRVPGLWSPEFRPAFHKHLNRLALKAGLQNSSAASPLTALQTVVLLI